MCNKVHLNENVRCTGGAGVNCYFGALSVCLYIYMYKVYGTISAPGKLSNAPVSRGRPVL